LRLSLHDLVDAIDEFLARFPGGLERGIGAEEGLVDELVVVPFAPILEHVQSPPRETVFP
jgi:hypothetical protein